MVLPLPDHYAMRGAGTEDILAPLLLASQANERRLLDISSGNYYWKKDLHLEPNVA